MLCPHPGYSENNTGSCRTTHDLKFLGDTKDGLVALGRPLDILVSSVGHLLLILDKFSSNLVKTQSLEDLPKELLTHM